MASPSNIKETLLTLCRGFIEARMRSAELSIQMAQASANEESKSSAGDKYETGRAMAQLEIEKGSVQFAEANKMMQALEQMSPNVESSVVMLGSLVYTNQGKYFLSAAVGQLIVDGVTWYAISPASPIGTNLKGLRVGDSFSFNHKEFVVEKVS